MTTRSINRWLTVAAGLAIAGPVFAQSERASAASRFRANISSEVRVVTPQTSRLGRSVGSLRASGPRFVTRPNVKVDPRRGGGGDGPAFGPFRGGGDLEPPSRKRNRLPISLAARGGAGTFDPSSPRGGPAGGDGDDGGGDDPGNGPGGGGDAGNLGGFDVLLPGDGFNGPTMQPAPVGPADQKGYDATAIARWDAVPYQTITEPFHLGVVAFHINDIDRVAFSLEGGPWVSVDEPRLNPRTQVEEYTIVVDPSLLPDGEFEVRAIVWPEVGEPRVLAGPMDWENTYQGPQWTGEHSMLLHANANGSSPNVVIEVPEGTYEWGELPGVPRDLPDDRWVTIQPAPGAEVTITPGLWRSQPHKVRLHDIELVQPERRAMLRGSTKNMLWFDGVEYTGPGMWELTDALKVKHQFWTGSVVREAQWGHAEHFIRNTRFESIGEDTIREAYFVVNVEVNNLGTPPPHLSWHPGVIANPIRHDNRIYYNVDILARQKGWALRNGTWDHWEHTDVAIVNCHTDKTTDGNQLLYLGGQVNHMLIKDCVWRGDRSWNYRLNDRVSEPRWRLNPRNVVFENNDWFGDPNWLPNPTPLPGITVVPISRVGQ